MRIVPSFLMRIPWFREFYYDVKLYPKRVRLYRTLFPFGKQHQIRARRRRHKVYRDKYGSTRISYGKRMAILQRDEFRCLRCGSKKDLTVDHIIPQARGGTTAFENLQTLCADCNILKADRTIDYRKALTIEG